jgi:hypothetical protein
MRTRGEQDADENRHQDEPPDESAIAVPLPVRIFGYFLVTLRFSAAAGLANCAGIL